LFSLISISQNISSDSRIAHQYYSEQDYEKALVLYKKLYTTTNSQTYHTYYINCMIELKRFAEIEKEIKKEIKKNKTNLSLYVDLGNVYKAQGLEDKANQQYEIAIKKLKPTYNVVSNLANAFIYKREYEWAEKTYIKGRKLLNGTYTFNYELANIYLYLHDYDKMINEYLSLLEINRSYLNSIQSRLQSAVYIAKDKDLNEVLKKNLILKIQKNPKNDVFQELLIWLYIQEKDFYSAFVQSKALDKRNKEDGERLYILGKLAAENKDYKTAIDCFNYIIDLGSDRVYYSFAKTELSEVLFHKITETTPTKEEVIKLEQLFSETIDELGKNKNSFQIIVNYAKLKAFYKREYSEAINILEDAIKIPSIKINLINRAKLTLGDIYLLKQEEWNATIYYAQVEQDNKNNPIGHEARFRKAKLAYYTGEFEWALAQLNVLKAATSKLISNDAFQLSSLISENLEADSTGKALKLYSRADFFIYTKNDSLAFITLDTIQDLYPSNSIIDEVLFMKGEIEYRNTNYLKSLDYYTQVSDNYEFDILADDALYKQAEIQYYILKNYEKAMELYKRIMIEHPDSYYSTEARKKFRELRGDDINKADS